MKHKKSVESLALAAKKKREKTIDRVKIAIQEMLERDIKINFKSVSRYANVSRDWLYKDQETKKKILEHRNKYSVISRSLDLHEALQKKEHEITTLKKRIFSMQNEIQHLNAKLQAAYGEIYNN